MVRAILGIAALALAGGLGVLAIMPWRTLYIGLSPGMPVPTIISLQAFLFGPAAGALLGIGLLLIVRRGR